MIINFLHKNHNCYAYVIYPNSKEDRVIAYILDFNSDLGYEIIFKRNAMNVWDTNENIKTKFPSTYYSLCFKLSSLFPGSNFINTDGLQAGEFAA